MALSNELISQFVKVTRDQVEDKQATTLRGTVKVSGDTAYVQIDGSDVLTPVTLTSDVKHNDRVMVLIENHTATVMGNTSDPSATTGTVQEVNTRVEKFNTVIAHKVTANELESINATIDNLKVKIAEIENVEAINAKIENLEALFADFKYISAEEADIIKAEIESLEADFANIDNISTEDLEALNADVTNLKGYTADFTYLSAEIFEATKAEVKQLSVNKMDVDFANIEFTDITKAKINEIYANSGLIKYVVSEDLTVTGELVGVTIKGDLIEAGTIKADQLVIKDSKDGLYYKLNFESGAFTDSEEVPMDGLHGSVLVANSVTAEKVSVSDLVAFDATIGGFHISDEAIFSSVKNTVHSSVKGVYMDSEGQVNFGDTDNFIKYYNDPVNFYRVDYDGDVTFTATDEPVEAGATELAINSNSEYCYTTDGKLVYYYMVYNSSTGLYDTVYCWGEDRYRLAISADSITYALNGSSRSVADIGVLTEYVKIGTYEDEPCIELGEHDSDFKLVITNTRILFKEGSVTPAYITNETLHINKAEIEEEMRVGGFVWKKRANGNMSLVWEEGD